MRGFKYYIFVLEKNLFKNVLFDEKYENQPWRDYQSLKQDQLLVVVDTVVVAVVVEVAVAVQIFLRALCFAGSASCDFFRARDAFHVD